MTPEQAADISARAYKHMTPWRTDQIEASLEQPFALLSASDHAFVLGQVIAGEAEILALAADPEHQRTGAASAALAQFLSDIAAREARTVFLEVSEENTPALAFYKAKRFAQVGRRPGYYHPAPGKAVDALILKLDLP
ncbi:GNAT family N-acetyltransferase [Pacificoceanicola onchidii]|uniref:GNAT family N-acetyltransferase n=1 Tax=Pacificoceanicola onchidii TaxID=2562685 RepID=UPI001F111F60|nr:GNAT family N-acetyltransferase [Pacificoceanicola onchidii]